MRTKLIAGFIVVAGFILLAGTPQVPGAIATRWFGYDAIIGYTQWALVGTTTATLAGDAGVRAMNDACLAEFPMSRMCASVEVMETVPHYDFSSAEWAWLRPTPQPSGSANPVVDISGRYGGGNLNCESWNEPTSDGLVVNPNGSFQTRACYVPRPVACCALIQVPEPSQNSGLAMGIAALGLMNRRRRS